MNYPQSKQILEEIKRAKRILVNCHRQPDPDSVGSALALYQMLVKMGKETEIICPTEISGSMSFLPYFQKIKTIDFAKFDFSNFDLFIALDSGSWYMVTGDPQIPQPKISLILIDHHKTNEKFGELNLVDAKASSTAEILYLVFRDWGIELDKDIATALLTGVISDTGAFRFEETTPKTIQIAGALMEKGADKNEIIFRLYFSTDFKLMKFWGEALAAMKVEEKLKFAWSAINYEKYLALDKPESSRESTATTFFKSMDDTDFGIFMLEEEKEKLVISLRSRTGLDVSRIALALGGGGHQHAAGATIYGLPFKEAVKKVLETARKFAKEKRNLR